MTASGELIADVNDDGHPDRVSDPSRIGTRFNITFGVGSADEATVGARALADYTGGRQEYVIGAAADFNRDGWTDLVIVAGDEQADDSPIYPRTAELRLGPFSNTGRGQRILPLGLGATSEMSVVDYNHDRYPDLAVYGHVGDGERMASARLCAGATALSATGSYDRGTEFESPARLPNSGLGRFYRRCSASGMTE
ncbi:FG-GAP repeat domain-containing protein [Streptomyces ipomoeae]|uniref:FG-GAP repeat domain-containing protein n=1 Tax=Streptomyces ipomoeae TaxID=103232 RepID=UPI0015F000DC|nr:VCBS repeat-containing protein [Streptomyces ipomoeae]MDX2939021.1 VCBS repeat-containing protein [Streptomyces ipomoeae]